MNLDPLKPYLSLIKFVIAAVLLCGAFVAGCNYKAKDVVQLETKVSTLEEANKAWAITAEEAEKQKEANQRFAEEQMKLAEEAAKEVVKVRNQTHKKIATLTEELEESKRIPECAELLKQRFCSAVPLYSSP